MILKVEKDKCIGCGACVATSPDVYDFDNENLAFVKVEEILTEFKENAIEAMENCPTEAIIKVK